MVKQKKIAIYSGAVPSTTFIERLIKGVADQGDLVYLFGWQQRKVTYSKNSKQFTFGSKWHKLYLLFRYSILLSVFYASDKRKLDSIIAAKKDKSIVLKVKYYPVLYHRPDIFHLQWAKSIEDWIWVQEFGIKLVLSLRGAHINYSPIADEKLKKTYEHYFPFVDGFHAVSKDIAIESTKYGADLEKIKVVYSGLDLNKLQYRNKENTTQNTLKIISVGRSHWKKGYTYALDVCATLQDRGIDFQYTIIGIDKEEELLFQRNQLNLKEKVVFKNNMPFEEVKNEIQSADILLLPSTEEGIANVVLEAMALGTLVVSTNCGGMEEVLQDGINGYVVPVRDPEAIVKALEKAMRLSQQEYQIMTEKARQIIESQHTEALMVSNMNALYTKVLYGKY